MARLARRSRFDWQTYMPIYEWGPREKVNSAADLGSRPVPTGGLAWCPVRLDAARPLTAREGDRGSMEEP